MTATTTVVAHPGKKLCRKCWRWRDVSNFHNRARSSDGLQIWCIECMRAAARATRAKIVAHDPPKRKRCCTCHETRPADAFHLASGARDGLQPQCKECTRLAARRWYRRHKAKQRQSFLRTPA